VGGAVLLIDVYQLLPELKREFGVMATPLFGLFGCGRLSVASAGTPSPI